MFSEEINQQQVDHFIHQSPWAAQEVMDAVSHQFVDLAESQRLKDNLNLLIDESAFSKKGKCSEGVARQYNGNRGKIDNCQVGVFGALSAGGLTSLVQYPTEQVMVGVVVSNFGSVGFRYGWL